jgi:hypothetical protein
VPTISENLMSLDQIRRDIRSKIIDKGVAVPAGTAFGGYPGKVDEISIAPPPPPAPTDSDTWERPVDWSVVPDPAANELYILLAVVENAVNTITFTLVGDYTIDWGDGTALVTSNLGTQTKTYDYANPVLVGTETAAGQHRQVVIKLTSSNLTTLDLSNPQSPRTYSAAFVLEIKGKLPTVSTLRLTKNTLTTGQLMPMLENVDLEIGVLGALTIGRLFAVLRLRLIVTNVSAAIASSAFNHLNRVKTIELNTSLLFRLNVSQTQMFSECWNLRSFTFEPNSLLASTSLVSWFRRCYSLKTCVFGAGSIPLVSQFNTAFENCFELTELTFPEGSLARTSMNLTGIFTNCNALSSVTFPANSLSSVSTMNTAFIGCLSIEAISFPIGAFTVLATNFQAAFFNCRSLRSISFLSPVRVNNLSSTFSDCQALRSLDFGSSSTVVTFMDNTFYRAYSLESLTGLNTTASIKLDSGQRFNGAALNALYAGLPVVSGGQTISIDNNPGVNDPVHDPSIATAKGWTLTL